MDKVDIAIKRLQEASQMSQQVYQKPLLVTYSGGKDSDAVIELAKISEIPFEVVHSHTTVDAPETVYHVRNKFHKLELDGYKCEIHMPVYKGRRTSMWDLIVKLHVPPTRFFRYCCSILKEGTGDGRFIATGVRWDESVKRANRGIYEVITKNIKDRIVLTNDNDEKRKLFESCFKRKSNTVNPIIDWSSSDVFNFLNNQKVKINPLYQKDLFNRVGCIGCPLANTRQRQKEFYLYPKYKKLYLIAFEKMLKDCEKNNIRKSKWETADDVFHWWMDDGFIYGQTSLFDEEDLEDN